MISVIIPAFNAGRFIARTINSVLAQTLPASEIIVVDDGSTDNTADVLRSYGDKVRYIYQENAGDGPARNTGIRAAKGEWIAFLDHDDEWLPCKLELQMQLLARYPELQWCGANRYQSDGKRCAVVGDTRAIEAALAQKGYFENFFTASSSGLCPVITSTMIVNERVFDQVGLFDSCWLRAADIDMWWRIAYSFPKFGYVPEPLAIVHLDADVPASRRYRSQTKRGADARKLIAKHEELARSRGMLAHFAPLARKSLQRSLLTTLYHGYKDDARAIVKQFSRYFPWYWRAATYVLTICPKVSSTILQFAAVARYHLGFEKHVSRRWIESTKTTASTCAEGHRLPGNGP